MFWSLLFVKCLLFVGRQTFHSGDANQSVHLVASEGLEAYLPLADMVDISAEVDRLSKRLSKMQTEYEGLVDRLNSPKVNLILLSIHAFYVSFNDHNPNLDQY